MKTSRAIAATVAVVTLAAGSAVAALRPRTEALAGAPQRLAATPAEGHTHAIDEHGLARRAPLPGAFRRYAVDGRTFVTTNGAEPSASAPPTLRLQGTWIETIVSADAGHETVVVTFSPDDVAPTTLSRDDLARPFVVERRADGRVVGVAFARGVTGLARQALRSFVAETQLARGDDPSASAWTLDEEDTTGQYRASYRVTSPREVERRKEAYQRVLSDRGLLPPARDEAYEIESVTRYGLDVLGAPIRIGVREKLRVTTGRDTPKLGALFVASVELLEAGRGPVPQVSVGPSERLASFSAAPLLAADDDAQMSRGADFPALLAKLAEIEGMSPEEQRRAVARTIGQARAVIRLDPKAAAEAARIVGDRRTDPTTAMLLANALAGAGTPEARAAILGLARSDRADVRLLTARALTQMRDGGPETLTTLKGMLADSDPGVATAASLALGANARGVAGDEAKASVDALAAVYDQASDAATQRTALLALGNAGGRDALPTLLDALDESGPLAEAATFALRFVPGEDVDQILDGALKSGSPGQRVAAVNAVLARDRSAWTPKLQALLAGDLPQQVRNAIASGLR